MRADPTGLKAFERGINAFVDPNDPSIIIADIPP